MSLVPWLVMLEVRVWQCELDGLLNSLVEMYRCLGL